MVDARVVLALLCWLAASPVVADSATTEAFPLGVAVGDVTESAAIFWTRPAEAGELLLQVSADGDFEAAELELVVSADEATDLAVRVEAIGLRPATTYFYRFVRVDGGASSTVGRMRTAPAPGAHAPLRIVFSGDTNFGTAPFPLMTAAADEEPDLFIWFGDTIYADSTAGGLPRATTLDQYRAKYRQIRSDEHARRLLAAAAVSVGADDHEVVNDYAGRDPRISDEQKRAAYQAFFEYLPIRRQNVPGDEFRMYRRMRWGETVDLFYLDGRQYRDVSAKRDCNGNPDPYGLLLGPFTADGGCQGALRGVRTMLGQEQFDWLTAGLRDSTAALKLVVNNVPLSYLGALPYDRWDGYDAERRRLLEFIDRERIRGVVFLTTDIHANFYNPDVTRYFRRSRPEYSLPNRIPVAEVIVGPLGNTTMAGTVYGGLEEVFGGRPLLTGVVVAAQAVATARLMYADGFKLVEPNRESYALLEIDASGRMRVRYRTSENAAETDGRAESTTAATFFDAEIDPSATPPRVGAPCLLPFAGAALLAVGWSARRREIIAAAARDVQRRPRGRFV